MCWKFRDQLAPVKYLEKFWETHLPWLMNREDKMSAIRIAYQRGFSDGHSARIKELII